MSSLTIPSTRAVAPVDWQSFLDRYRSGEWRAKIFRDLVLQDIKTLGTSARAMDIGCGQGFDNCIKLQSSLAQAAGAYVGVEPDSAVDVGPHVQQLHRSFFEDAPHPDNSIDVAFCVMVLEHIQEPARFWNKLLQILAPGGVFWGFTMDARHPFRKFSMGMQHARIKDIYLRLLKGKRGDERYANYPTYYRCNSPEAIAKYSGGFSRVETFSFSREGQLDYYLPKPLRGVMRWLDRRAIARNKPGTLLAIRAEK